MCGIPIDIQVRSLALPTFEVTLNNLRKEFDSLLQNYELQNVDSAMDLLKKWDRVNSRDNSFWVSSHLVSTAFGDSLEVYFQKLYMKDFIVDELKHYKYDWNAKIELGKKNNSINMDEVHQYLDCFRGIRSTLVSMATNRSNLFSHLDKTYDFIYFVHIGVGIFDADKTPRKSGQFFQGSLHVPNGAFPLDQPEEVRDRFHPGYLVSAAVSADHVVDAQPAESFEHESYWVDAAFQSAQQQGRFFAVQQTDLFERCVR